MEKHEYIKFIDLKKINSDFATNIHQLVDKSLDVSSYINGNNNQEFEQNFAKFCQTKYAISCGNGLDALKIILNSYNFEKDSEIIVPANTFIATALAVSENNLKLVLVDPNPNTFCLDVKTIKQNLTNKTKAIILVHLYGLLTLDIFEIRKLANNNNIKLIEDAAQAHGAILNGHRAGSFGDAAAFSFYPTKNIGCLGDGGIITTNDEKLYKKAIALRNYGSNIKYFSDFKGFNSRLDDIQAGILNIKLKQLDTNNECRLKIAQKYINNIKNNKISIIDNYSNTNNVCHIFPIFSNRRNELKTYLETNGIQTQIHYPVPIHKQSAYSEFNNMQFPITETLCNTELSLPIHQALTDSEVDFIIKTINNW